MDDVFVEQIVEKKQDTKEFLSKIGIVAGATVLSSVFLLIGVLRFIFPFVLAGSCWGAYQLIRNLNFEFEYSFTNGELDVDKIIGRRKRERLLSVKVRSFELMAPSSDKYRNEFESATVASSIDASISPQSEDRWFAIYTDSSGIKTLLYFNPSERLRTAMRRYNQRNIKED